MKRLFANKKFSLHTWVAAAALTVGIIGSPANAAGSIDARGFVNSASFSPDGKRVVTASADGAARVWDVGTGKPVGEPMMHGGPVNSASLSPDGKRVVTASWDGTARVWDAGTGKPMAEPMTHGLFVQSAAFSPDGKRVVTASWDGTARVWDVGTGKPVGEPIPSLSASAQKDIRGVDFRNFTYEYGLGEPETITVRDGEFAREIKDDPLNPLYFSIVDVVYGDVTRDGQDDAVVRTVLSGGGSGSFSDATIYTMRGGKPVAIWSLGVGDRANGGIHDVRIENGRIVVERYGHENSGDCCPQYIERNCQVPLVYKRV